MLQKILLESNFKKDDLILLRPETKLKIEDTSKVIGKKINKNIYKFDEIKLSSVN